MVDWLPYFFAGLLVGAALAGIVGYKMLVRWQHAASDMETQLRSHSFELQVTLDELAEKNQQLEKQSQRDALSGIYNRAYFDRQMSAEVKRSRREQRSLAIILFDIDHFKKINDTYGHLAGDQAIKQVSAAILQQLKRPGDKLCRYGGEEFALILPNTTLAGARQLAEQIRQYMADNKLLLAEQHVSLTLSAGCYAAIPQPATNNDEYIAFADTALYRAKSAGRNQVQSYPPMAASDCLDIPGEVNEH
ncbi:GGDEF domain-containing protein [Rheinheimera baltica]|uniref:GGDEF domain-containing protein n=1 Tax=Rheinheimera baltica TaxID=67576 RepID=UPI00273F483B|nr:GGDEF domain-containing protein [Rheinheimera baltica]MDP5142238.1 GGDEF domain-containing protein [Rheinheimera baltica]